MNSQECGLLWPPLTKTARYRTMEKSASRNREIPFYALIAAAGSGTRLGGERPKQYTLLGRKTVLRHSIEAFLACSGLKELRVIIDPAHEDFYHESVRGLDLPPPVTGSGSRKNSVFNGINNFSHLKTEDILLIHDAARPFIKRREIEALLSVLDTAEAATLGTPVADTLRRGTANEYVDRSGLWAIQTPQGFRYGILRRAHEQAANDPSVTDDTMLVAALGIEPKIVEAPRENFKITTMPDLELARKIINAAVTVTRTGFGFDVHAFDKETHSKTGNGSVRLCGIDVPHAYRLKGHSDADVGLHALTDAILGAMAAGDIGHHFPPSDPQWKNADSSLFLRHAVDIVIADGGTITNLDLTLICEGPKVGPHRTAMQNRVAQICGITPGQVGIKATTTEMLGFTGRGEGIAAQAVATLSLPAETSHE